MKINCKGVASARMILKAMTRRYKHKEILYTWTGSNGKVIDRNKISMN